MKRSYLIVAIIVTALVVSVLPAEAQRAGRGRGGATGPCSGTGIGSIIKDVDAPALTSAEVAMVQSLREEEKMARDVYLALGERWNMPIFFRIARSEQQHMDAVAALIARDEIEDPVVDDTPGAFTDPTWGDLYLQLVDQGQVSLIDALIVGATIEDLDINDLNQMLETTDNDVLRVVIQNLNKGSRNHLRAFTAALASQDSIYEPRYLDAETFDAIVSSDREIRVVYGPDGEVLATCGRGGRGGSGQGGGTCDGTGPGNGNGGSGNGSGGQGSGTCPRLP
jgi:hypothetical protein